jgi:ribosomal protein S18 acetylase RimI-like enzyme
MNIPSFEILDLRQLKPSAMEPLLQDESVAWRRDLLWDYTATAAMIRRFLASRSLNGYAAVERGLATGFTFFVYEAGKGLVGDLFVRPEFRREVVYTALLTHTLETLEATPGIRRVEAQLLQADSPAVRSLFAARGYVCYDRSFLQRPLTGAGGPIAPGGEERSGGFQIAGWEATRFLDSANLITRAYAGHVDCEVSDQYRTQAGAMRFLDNIIHYPGCGEFYPPASLLAFPAQPSAAQPCGLLLTSVVSDGVAHITQLCVAPEQQGRGVGKALLAQALARLTRAGFRTVTLTATDANRSAMNLYGRYGFEILLRFPAFVWEAAAGLRGYPAIRS